MNFVDTGTLDFMARSTVLRKHASTRVFFDATNPQHCASLKTFIETGNWGAMQFYPEFPFTDVPMTALMKFAAHHLQAGARLTNIEQLALKEANANAQVETAGTPATI